MSTPIPAEVEEYLRLIEGDSPRACKDQHALAAYVRGVFAREELTVDREQLDRYLSLTRYFDFPQLFPWEAFLLALWDCTYTQDGVPRWPELFCLVGRGAGKDGFIGFDGFCCIELRCMSETEEVVLYGKQTLGFYPSFCHCHDLCALAVDQKSVLAARSAPERLTV